MPPRLHTGRVNLGLTYRVCVALYRGRTALFMFQIQMILVPVNENSFFFMQKYSGFPLAEADPCMKSAVRVAKAIKQTLLYVPICSPHSRIILHFYAFLVKYCMLLYSKSK